MEILESYETRQSGVGVDERPNLENVASLFMIPNKWPGVMYAFIYQSDTRERNTRTESPSPSARFRSWFRCERALKKKPWNYGQMWVGRHSVERGAAKDATEDFAFTKIEKAVGHLSSHRSHLSHLFKTEKRSFSREVQKLILKGLQSSGIVKSMWHVTSIKLK